MALTINSILVKKLFTYRLWINPWDSPDKSLLNYHKTPKGTNCRFLRLKAKKQPPRPFRTKIFKTLSLYVDIAAPVVKDPLLRALENFTLEYPKITSEIEVHKYTNFCAMGKAGVL